MRDSKLYKILSIIFSVQLVFSLVPCDSVAEQLIDQSDGKQESQTTEVQGAGESDDSGTNTPDGSGAGESDSPGTSTPDGSGPGASDGSGATTPEDPATNDDSSSSTKDVEAPNTSTSSASSNPVQPFSDDVNTKPEVRAVSSTQNIVGEVFANAVNKQIEQGSQNEEEGDQEPVLEDAARESHDEDYYAGSARLRTLEDTDGNHLGFMVYRDSYLIISQEESKNYTVSWSENKRTAFVTPAISTDQLAGKTGIVFLGDNVGADEVLVFDGTPTVDGDTLVVPVADTDDLTLSDLFSDGSLHITAQSDMSAEGAGFDYEGFDEANDGLKKKNLVADGWSADISNLELDDDVGCWLDIDLFELKFDLVIHLGANFDFDVRSNGTPCGRESQDIAKLSIPVKLFTLKFQYKFEAEFDNKPVNIAGSMKTSMDYHISPIFGMHVENFQAPVTIEQFSLINPATGDEVDTPANEDINCYVGSAFQITQGFLGLDIDLWFIHISIGPIVSLNHLSQGGARITAKLEKDTYDPDNFDRASADSVHLCAEKNKDGCYDIHTTEVSRNTTYLKLDLFFASWEWNLSDDSEQTIAERDFYRSLTKNDPHVWEGICPHHLYKVPVQVQVKEQGGTTHQVPNISVSSSAGTESGLMSGTTDDDGKVNIFLPYADNTRHTITAAGEYGGIAVKGSERQPQDMQREDNPEVTILIGSTATTTVSAQLTWDVDKDEKDEPRAVFVATQMLNHATGQWETVGWLPVFVSDPNIPAHPTYDHWTWDGHAWPKFSLVDGTYVPNEFRIFELKEVMDVDLPEGISQIEENDDHEVYYKDVTTGKWYGYSGNGSESASEVTFDEDTLNKIFAEIEAREVESTAQSPAFVPRSVRFYTDSQGLDVPEHRTTYQVSYATSTTSGTEGNETIKTTINHLAVADVRINKEWKLAEGATKPDKVYLALQQKPQTQWEEYAESHGRNYAGTLGVPTVWVTALNPIEGQATTLRQLMQDNTLNPISVQGIADVPLAIAKVQPTDDDTWSTSFTVRKYRDGIPLQFEAVELDTKAVRMLLNYEFDVNASAEVTRYWTGASIPGYAHSHMEDATYHAAVTNTSDDPDHTIGGTIFWYNAKPGLDIPDKVKIHVKNGSGTEEIASVEVKKADFPDKTIWTWSLTDDNISSVAPYTVSEEFFEYGEYGVESFTWAAEYEGLDVINHWTGHRTVYITIEASIDAPANNQRAGDTLNVYLLDENGNKAKEEPIELTYKEQLGLYSSNALSSENSEFAGKDLLHYSVQEINPEVCTTSGNQVFPIYDDPTVALTPGQREGTEIPHYTFHVTNVVQSQMLFDFEVLWKDAEGDPAPPSGTLPDSINVNLYQDTKKVGTDIQITKDGQGNWKYDNFAGDEGQTPLMPMRDENHRYDYSIDVTTHVAGYSTEVTEDESDPMHPKYTITYTALDPNNRVDVQGTVAWEGDDQNKDLRPNTVHLAIVAQNGDDASTARTVQQLDVTVNKDGSTEDTWTVKDLPRYADDNMTVPIKYSVLESHVMGYTTKYPTPTFDESANPPTWTCNVTNTLSAYLPLTIEKKIANKTEDVPSQVFTFNIAAKKLSEDDERTYPEPKQNNIQITDEGTNKFEFLIEKVGIYAYTIEEAPLDEPWKCESSKRNVLISATLGTDGKMSYRVWVSDPKDTEKELSYTVNSGNFGPLYSENIPDLSTIAPGTNTWNLSANEGTSQLGDDGTQNIVFTNGYGKKFEIKKDWDIDLQKKDKPESIQVAIQKKKAKEENGNEEKEEWETVDLVELNDANNWTETTYLNEGSDGGDNEDAEYRVRELKEETALETLGKQIKQYIANQNLDALKSALESSTFWSKVPDAVKTKVASSTTFDELLQNLGTSTSSLYDRLMDVLGIPTASDRIVYDSEDKDKPKDEEGNDKETNRVTYSVKAYTSNIGEGEGAHKTKYQVTYDKSDDAYSITNKAILEIDVIKRWIAPGVDEDKMPKSAWVVLLCKPKESELQAAQQAGLLDSSNSGGVQFVSVDSNETYNVGDIPLEEFPALNPIEGGIDPVNLISQLTIGIPISIFSGILPTIAVAKVDKDCNWTAKFVVSKYAAGISLEYKGAELVSEIIRQIIKYLVKIDLPISFNPFDGYISIPTKAIRTIAGITQVEDLLDFSKLSGAALEKAKTLTMDDIRDFGPSTLLDDWHLMANVINLKFDGDVDPDPEPEPEPGTIYGKKTWDDDNDKLGHRPQTVKVYLLANGERVKDSDGNDVYAETSEAGNWKYFFPNMPEEDDQGETITYTVEEDPVPDYYTATVDGTNITNKLTSLDLEGKKTWEDSDNKDGLRPQSIIIHLLANGKDVRQLSVSESDGWKWEFANVPIYDQGKEIEYTVEEEPIKGYSTTADGLDVTNTHTSEMADVLVRKIWRDNDDQDGKRPETVTLHLFADGTEVDSVVVSESDDWQHTFTGMPVHNKDDKRIAYSVSEDTVEDYTASISGLTITNTYAPGKTQVHVRKTWDDAGDQDGIRPKTVTIKLLADGTDTGKKLELAEANSWAGSFSNLDKYNSGTEIAYTIEEVSVDGYDTTMSGDASSGFVVSNKHVPETFSVAGKKTWDDADDTSRRPSSITVRLLANGKQVDARTVTEQDGWKWEFKDLPKYEDGELVKYTVSEDSVEDYTSTVNGYDITNKHTPGKTQIHVSKQWEDEDDQDGIRPKSVTVRLFADGTDTGRTLVLNKNNNWEGSFTDLDKTKDGKEILYYVEEDAIEGYKGTVLNNLGGPRTRFFIINKHTPATVDVLGQKTWDDAADPSHRPSSIVVRLRADGAVVDVRTVTEQDEWKWEFRNLPKYRDGHQIVYTVSEDVLDDYSTTISTEGYDITNSYTPGKTQVNVSKQWDDTNNQDGIRPESVTVRLLANGEAVEGKTLELNQENRWSGSFTDLNKTDDSGEILYTVEEVTTDVITGTDGPGTYAFTISGDAVTGFVVTNIHTPEQTQVPVSKVWVDADNKDGIRPESVTVRLLADGEDTGKALELSAGNKWTGAFSELQKYQDGGKLVAYTVEEVTTDVITGTDGPGTYAFAVSGDSTAGFVVTNTHNPDKTRVPVSKVWEDADNKDSIRPESVTVRLLADGEDTGKTLELSAGNEWAGSFDDLDKYRDGVTPVAYTVEEVTTDVITGTDGPGTYAFAVSGDATAGFVVTNTHTPVSPDTPMYVITYVLNGGTYEGSKADIKETYPAGTVISIHKAPVRDGYTFTYWKGSEYQPGDKYTVTGDHTFVAQWKKNTTPSNSSSKTSGSSGSTTGRTTLASTADASYSQALTMGMAALGLALCGAAVLHRRRS